MHRLRLIAAATCGVCIATAAFADGPGSRPRLDLLPQAPAAPSAGAPIGPAQPISAPAGIDRSSEVALPGALLATLPASLNYYTPAEAEAYLARIGQPRPQGQIAGMIAPTGPAPDAADFWGFVVSYEALGHVPERNTAKLAAPTFINEVRAARGAAAPRLAEFTQAPVYIAQSDSLIWAERLERFDDNPRTIAFSQRLLGREGVAKLDAYLLPEQQAAAQRIAGPALSALTFTPGQRHSDFRTGDRASRFDVPGLISGRDMSEEPAAAANVTSADAASGAMPTWAPWAAIGAAVIGAVAWLAFLMRRNRERVDPNLTPS